MIRTLKSCTQPRWANIQHTAIDCIAAFEEVSGVYPFTAVANDSEEHGRKLFEDLVAGKYGVITEYEPPPKLKSTSTIEKGPRVT